MNPASDHSIDFYQAPPPTAQREPKRFHVMAKPVGSTCNLDCSYCYYLSKESLPKGPGAGTMSDETLELFVKQYIESAAGGEVIFSWQGGEPTLLGLECYRKAVAFEKSRLDRMQAAVLFPPFDRGALHYRQQWRRHQRRDN